MSDDDIVLTLKRVERMSAQIGDLDDKMKSMTISNMSDDELSDFIEKCEQYEDSLNLVHIRLTKKLEVLNSVNNLSLAQGQNFGSAQAVNRPKLKLPNLTLPSFYGDITKDTMSCESFFELYEKLITGYGLNYAEKYGMMAPQIKGDAKTIIDSLTVAQLDYDFAKKLLMETYSQKVPLQFAVIKKFISLKMTGSPVVYNSQVRNILENMSKVKVDMDVMKQYFVWNGMPIAMQDYIIQMSNSDYPDYQQISDHMIAAGNRYMVRNPKSIQKTVDVSSNAIALKTDNIEKSQSKTSHYNNDRKSNYYCYFCDNTSHSSTQCKKYSSLESKNERIKSAQMCKKCLKKGHSMEVCNFKLKNPCKKCASGKFHWEFLCSVVVDKDLASEKFSKTPTSKKKENSEIKNDNAIVDKNTGLSKD